MCSGTIEYCCPFGFLVSFGTASAIAGSSDSECDLNSSLPGSGMVVIIEYCPSGITGGVGAGWGSKGFPLGCGCGGVSCDEDSTLKDRPLSAVSLSEVLWTTEKYWEFCTVI